MHALLAELCAHEIPKWFQHNDNWPLFPNQLDIYIFFHDVK